MLQWLSDNAGLMNLIFSAVVASATVVYALLTWSLVRETKRMRRAQTDPDIAVYLEPDENTIGVLHLVIRNIGSGPAYRLRFDLDDIRVQGWGGESIRRFSIWGTELPFLAPGSSIRTLAGAVFEEGARDFSLRVKVRYGTADGSTRNSDYELPFSVHVGRTRLGEPPMKKIANEIEAIRRLLENRSG